MLTNTITGFARYPGKDMWIITVTFQQGKMGFWWGTDWYMAFYQNLSQLEYFCLLLLMWLILKVKTFLLNGGSTKYYTRIKTTFFENAFSV